jgi:iron(III) transport system substrate-binding protein
MSIIARLRRVPVLAAAGLLAVTALAGCGGGSSEVAPSGDPSYDAVVARAVGEGKVVVYTSTPEAQEKRLVEAFNEKYPDIKVQVVRGAGELPERLAAERRSNAAGADVLTFSDPSWFTKNAADVSALDSPAADAWPADYWGVDHKAALSSIAPFGMIVWNTQKFPAGFRTWDDLLAPAVTGQLGTRSDMTAAYAGFLDFAERRIGPDYLNRLGAQHPKFYPSAVPMVQAVASGEIGVTNLSVPIIVEDLKAKGAPIEAVVPKPGYGIAFASGVLENAKNPNAARVYLDFLLSPTGQAAYNGDGIGASALPGIAGTIPLDGLELFQSEKFTPEVLAEWQRKTDAAFG